MELLIQQICKNLVIQFQDVVKRVSLLYHTCFQVITSYSGACNKNVKFDKYSSSSSILGLSEMMIDTNKYKINLKNVINTKLNNLTQTWTGCLLFYDCSRLRAG